MHDAINDRRVYETRPVNKVLVADNNPVMLALLHNILAKNGCEVVTAEDGLTVLEILASYKPDVIFIDLIMPNIDGERLCRVIRSMPHMNDVFLVIISAIAAETKIPFNEWGADACIAKGPYDKMSRSIKSLLERIETDTFFPAGWRVLGPDYAHPREITAELLSLKSHLETILSSISEGIIEITPEGRVVFVNPEAVEIIGGSEEKILATDITELFKEEERTKVGKALVSPRTSHHAAEESVLANGKEVSFTVAKIKNDRNKLVILSDLGLRKHLEAELRQAQKLEALGTLARGIAHDFNNLLMEIQGRTSLMLLKAAENDFLTQNLKAIEDIVLSGANLTRQLLEFAQNGKYVAEPTDLNDLVQRTAKMFGRTKKEIDIELELEENPWVVEVDRGQIEQALLNLCINARQAMPDGGTIYLNTENVRMSKKEADFRRVKPGRYVKLTVGDTGTGMDEQTRQKIFEPFFTTKEKGIGTGLGLSSVYGIVKGHNGFIEVESKMGQGTTFTIYLPATGKKVLHERKAAEKILPGKETILLVDDEEVVTNVVREMLESLGYTVISALNGKDALELYRQDWDRIDLVILDMIMPQMSGYEVFEALKALNPKVKVILATGYSMKEQAAKIMERGCRAFMQKPFSIQELSNKIRTVLDADE
ncbi:MAG: response regulator [Syntrophobacterales bacterium]|nr:response regulator [Syntrophobacterales bacterium]